MTITPLHLQTITIFGDYGTGKTSAALGNPKALHYDLEDGKPDAVREAADFPVERTWVKFKEAITAAYKGDKRFDGHTLVIDPVAKLVQLCVKQGLAERGLKELPDDFGRTRSAIRGDFEDVFNMLLHLRTAGRMGTVFIAHEAAEELQTESSRTVRLFRADAGDAGKPDNTADKLISRRPQIIIRAFVADEHPKTLMPFDEPRFLLSAKRLKAQDLVKDRTGRLPALVPTSWNALEKAYASTETAQKKSEKAKAA